MAMAMLAAGLILLANRAPLPGIIGAFLLAILWAVMSLSVRDAP
jgi:hypothetical protein